MSGSTAVLCPRCNAMFDEKVAENYEVDKKGTLKEEKLNISRFVFDKSGAHH